MHDSQNEEQFMQRRASPHKYRGQSAPLTAGDMSCFLGKLQVCATVLLLLLPGFYCLPAPPISRPIQPIYRHRYSADSTQQNQKYLLFRPNQAAFSKDGIFTSSQQVLNSAYFKLGSSSDIRKEVSLEISSPSLSRVESSRVDRLNSIYSLEDTNNNPSNLDVNYYHGLAENRELSSDRLPQPNPVTNFHKALNISSVESRPDGPLLSALRPSRPEPEPSEARPTASNVSPLDAVSTAISRNEAVSTPINQDEAVSTAVSRVTRDTARPRSPDFAFEEERLAIAANLGPMERAPRRSWQNPCKVDTSPDPDATPASLSQHIFATVNAGHKHANRFKERFALRVYGMDWDEILKEGLLMYDDVTYGFLKPRPVVPTPEEMESLSFDEQLQFTYEMMQRRAVAIEAVTLDQALYRDVNSSDFIEDYRKIEREIVAILCELRYAMSQQGIEPATQISSDIMPQELRDLDTLSYRDNRDAVILREYLLSLDYLMNVYRHFMGSGS